MVRLAIWFESQLGRNDGNPLYVTAFLKRVQYFSELQTRGKANERLTCYFPNNELKDERAEALAKSLVERCGGIEIEHLRPYGDDLHTYGKFDYHIWVDWGEDGLTGLLPYTPIIPSGKICYWASDTHLGYDYRYNFAKQCSLVFCAQRKAARSFTESGVNAVWLPHAFEPLAYPKYTLASKKTDVCFVGHVNSENRIDFLDRMFREYPDFFYGVRRFEDASHKYAESRVVLNIAMLDDLNMRVFEALGSGSFLLTDRCDSLEDLFEDKKHLALYTTPDEAVDLTRYYLDNPKERSAIAEQGYKEVLENHTISNRVTKMVNAILEDMHS